MPPRFLRRVSRLTATALAAVNLPRPPAPPASVNGNWEYLKTRMLWFIRRHMRKAGVPGISIALVSDQQLVWAEGLGFADRERRRPAGPETVYQIGSITKVLNAILVMQLVAQGRLRLDAPLTDYLPGFSMRTRWPRAAPITVRSLLCHHAGLPTYYLKGFFSSQPLASLPDELRDEHLAYEPHTVFNYSNLGPNLLGLVVERLTGLPYANAMQQSLLAPLGMRHSGFVADQKIGAHLACGYVHDRPVTPTPVRDLPAGGLYSNVLDLARFMQFVFAGGQANGQSVLEASRLAETLSPQYADRPLNFSQRFGLGWMLSGLPVEHAGPQAWHNGGTKAFLSQLALLPERKLGVIVLANADTAGSLVHETAEEALRLALEVRHGLVSPPRPRAPEISVSHATLARHVGDYSLMGSLARITLGRKRLRLHVLNHKLDLVPVAENRFRVEFNLLGIKSVPIPFPPVEFKTVDGRAFALLRDRVVVPAEKIPPYAIPSAWRQFTGAYRLLNPDAEFLVNLEHCRMEIADGRLLMDIRISGIENREVKVVLVPLNDEEACVFGLGRNVGDVSRCWADGQRRFIRFSGYLFELER